MREPSERYTRDWRCSGVTPAAVRKCASNIVSESWFPREIKATSGWPDYHVAMERLWRVAFRFLLGGLHAGVGGTSDVFEVRFRALRVFEIRTEIRGVNGYRTGKFRTHGSVITERAENSCMCVCHWRDAKRRKKKRRCLDLQEKNRPSILGVSALIGAIEHQGRVGSRGVYALT